MAKYIALIGAFERDNFGDLLFLQVTKKLLSPWPIVPLCFASSDMTKEGAGNPVSASSWFDVCEQFLPHAIIFSGGETLGCDISTATSFLIPEKYSELFKILSENEKKELGHALSWRSGNLPYVSHERYINDSRKNNILIAYNSVGGIGIKKEHSDDLGFAIKDSAYSSMREALTTSKIKQYTGVTTETNPDIVSLISECCQDEVNQARPVIKELRKRLKKKFVIFQASDKYMIINGIEKISLELLRLSKELDCALVLQPAGIASGHDSFSSLDELQLMLIKLGLNENSIAIQRNRDIWTQVAAIAESICFIGTSLHGRIVATSYAKPRVGLCQKNKITNYGQQWEGSLQPTDVKIEQLTSATAEAIKVGERRLQEHSLKIRTQTRNAFKNLQLKLDILPHPLDTKPTLLEIDRLERKSALNEINRIRNYSIELYLKLSKIQKENKELKHQITSIKSSLSWKITSPLRIFKSLIFRYE